MLILKVTWFLILLYIGIAIWHLFGLIHITEMGHDNVAHPGDVIAEGDSVQVTILRIESDRRRLGLSLKQSESVDEEPTSYTSEE